MQRDGSYLLVALGLVSSLIGVIYWIGRGRDDRQDQRLEKHVDEDVRAHERIAALEVKVDAHAREITSLREKWHDMRGEMMRALADWYNDLAEQIRKLKDK